MLEFLSVLFNTFQQANVHTAIFINGALEPDRSGALSFFLVSKKMYGLRTFNRTTGSVVSDSCNKGYTSLKLKMVTWSIKSLSKFSIYDFEHQVPEHVRERTADSKVAERA
jgi:hypothetical protein